LKEGARGRWPVTAGGLDGGAADPRPEVGDDPDLRAPPVGGWSKKERREAAVGPGEEEELGRPAARTREMPSARAGLWAAERER
jgi:hypothetical protein